VLGVRMYRYGNFLAWLSRRASQLASRPELWEMPCAIWTSALKDVLDLTYEILQNIPQPLRQMSELEHDHIVYTDASDLGYGIVHCGTRLQKVSQGKWPSKFLRTRIIAERELYALGKAVEDVRSWNFRHIHALNDNTNVVTWVTRGRGKSYFSNSLLTTLFKDLGSTVLSLEYVPSAQNLADAPSRYFPS
jgi:hypothetical protein